MPKSISGTIMGRWQLIIGMAAWIYLTDMDLILVSKIRFTTFSSQFYVDNMLLLFNRFCEVTDSCFPPISRQMVRREAWSVLHSTVCPAVSLSKSREHQCGVVCSRSSHAHEPDTFSLM